MKTDPKARYQGYAFFFREGFCWNNVLNPKARLLKARLKNKSINDVGSMSLCSLVENLPNNYFVSILNSNLIFDYYREFINCTVNIQINDIRQLPIIIPNESQCREIENIFFQAMQYKTKSNSEKELKAIENELDNKVVNLYGI
ncbi:MAG: DNA modification methylase [Proteiniphilum sp.]|nr:DNA modification methylase [Proteiniphilum sp.]